MASGQKIMQKGSPCAAQSMARPLTGTSEIRDVKMSRSQDDLMWIWYLCLNISVAMPLLLFLQLKELHVRSWCSPWLARQQPIQYTKVNVSHHISSKLWAKAEEAPATPSQKSVQLAHTWQVQQAKSPGSHENTASRLSCDKCLAEAQSANETMSRLCATRLSAGIFQGHNDKGRPTRMALEQGNKHNRAKNKEHLWLRWHALTSNQMCDSKKQKCTVKGTCQPVGDVKHQLAEHETLKKNEKDISWTIRHERTCNDKNTRLEGAWLFKGGPKMWVKRLKQMDIIAPVPEGIGHDCPSSLPPAKHVCGDPTFRKINILVLYGKSRRFQEKVQKQNPAPSRLWPHGG